MKVFEARRYLEEATRKTEEAVNIFMQPADTKDPEVLKTIINDITSAGLALAVRYIDETGLDVQVPIDGDA